MSFAGEPLICHRCSAGNSVPWYLIKDLLVCKDCFAQDKNETDRKLEFLRKDFFGDMDLNDEQQEAASKDATGKDASDSELQLLFKQISEKNRKLEFVRNDLFGDMELDTVQQEVASKGATGTDVGDSELQQVPKQKSVKNKSDNN